MKKVLTAIMTIALSMSSLVLLNGSASAQPGDPCSIYVGLVGKTPSGTHAYGEVRWQCNMAPTDRTNILVRISRWRGVYWEEIAASNFSQVGAFDKTFGVLASCQGTGLYTYRLQTVGNAMDTYYSRIGGETRFNC